LEKICRSYASFRFSGGKLSLSCVEQKRSLWWIWKKAWDVLLSKISSSNQFWRDRPNTNCTVHSPTTILSVKLTHVVTQDCWLIKTTFLIHLIYARTLNNWVYISHKQSVVVRGLPARSSKFNLLYVSFLPQAFRILRFWKILWHLFCVLEGNTTKSLILQLMKSW
jgi:hypothetical protein